MIVYCMKLLAYGFRYDSEDFGVRSYLNELLNQGKEVLATEYYTLCTKYIQTSNIWDKFPELATHKEWLMTQKMQ
jgi:hypothetical protein